ncbi:MAG: FliH/SctL family protein [Azospirillaceae bacterium]
MAHLRRYLFETSFDPDEPEPAATPADEAPPEPEPEPEPSYDQAALDAAVAEARAAAYAEGEAAGRGAAEAALEQRVAATLDGLGGQLSGLIEARQRSDTRVAEDAARLARTAAGKLMPALARQGALEEIDALLRDCLAELREEPRIVVRVPDALLDPVRDRLDRLTAGLGFSGAVVLLAEDSLGPTDCRVEWADGGAERVTQRVVDRIDAALARYARSTTDEIATTTPAAEAAPNVPAAKAAPTETAARAAPTETAAAAAAREESEA